MTEKFDVSIGDKDVKLELRRPKERESRELEDYSLEMSLKLKDILPKFKQPELMTEGEIRIARQYTKDKRNKYKEILIACCTNETLKSAEDFEEMASEDVARLFRWLEEKAGIIQTNEQKGFTKT